MPRSDTEGSPPRNSPTPQPIPNGDHPPPSAAAVESVEQILTRAEQLFAKHRSDQNALWREEVRFALRQAEAASGSGPGGAEAQSEALAVRSREVKATTDADRWALEEARLTASEEQRMLDSSFVCDIQELGEAKSEQALATAQRAALRLKKRTEAWEENSWRSVDRALTAEARQQADSVRAVRPGYGLAEAHGRGKLMPLLAEEAEGWARSQRSDVQHLQSEVDREYEPLISGLEARLERTVPEALSTKHWEVELDRLDAAASARLGRLREEAHEVHRAQVCAVERQCEEDFRGYDGELQRSLFADMEDRFLTAKKVRELKIVLCRWRLDFQREYHSRRRELMAEGKQARGATPPGTPGPAGATSGTAVPPQLSTACTEEVDRRRFTVARGLVRDLWARGRVPPADAHELLGRCLEAAARAGDSAPAAEVYQDELRRRKAEPLLGYARRPELLQCWLEQTSSKPGS